MISEASETHEKQISDVVTAIFIVLDKEDVELKFAAFKVVVELCDSEGDKISAHSAKKCVHALQNSIGRMDRRIIPSLAQMLLEKVIVGMQVFVSIC